MIGGQLGALLTCRPLRLRILESSMLLLLSRTVESISRKLHPSLRVQGYFLWGCGTDREGVPGSGGHEQAPFRGGLVRVS